VSKETYYIVKRDLLQCQKSAAADFLREARTRLESGFGKGNGPCNRGMGRSRREVQEQGELSSKLGGGC
jgi:hypothetical protein